MLSRCLARPRYSCLQYFAYRAAQFRTTCARPVEVVDHYKILDIQPNASPAVIKKQYYALSKAHHPDHHPDDPKAADRFVKITDAYHILGHPELRERYDHEFQIDVSSGARDVRKGSYSSTAPFGSRPASGLSKRKSQFRGPPPSFYRSGGWGKQSAKRQAQADAADTASFNAAMNSSTASHPGRGSGPNKASRGFDDDVPHFDRPSHLKTQEQQEQRRMRQRAQEAEMHYAVDNTSSVLLNFLLISGIIAIGCAIPVFSKLQSASRERKES